MITRLSVVGVINAGAVLGACYYISKVIVLLFKKLILSIINISLIHASTPQFRWKIDPVRLKNSKNILGEYGLQPISDLNHAYVIRANDVHLNFIRLGCRKMMQDEKAFFVFSHDNQKVKTLCEKMHIPFVQDNDECKIALYNLPCGQRVIYCPGSGHIFEFRKKTIAYFSLQLGLDVIVFHYPGVQGREGPVCMSELQNSVDEIVKHQLKCYNQKDLILYGHCVGSNIMASAIKKYPEIKVIVDRGFDTVQEVAEHSLKKKGFDKIPYLVQVLSKGAQKFYPFSIKNDLNSNRKQKQLILYSSHDEFLPGQFQDPKSSFLESRECLDLKSTHDEDLPTSEIDSKYISSKLTEFLKNS